MDNFLIIRLSSLGDIIHTLPAFSALRKKFPESKITWLVEEKGKEILDFVPGIDRVIVVRAKRWRGGSKKFWKELSRLKNEIKNRDQIALDFQGLVKSGFLAFLSRAQKRIGFHRKNLKEPFASLFYTDRLEEIHENNHVIKKNLKLLNLVGIQNGKYKKYEFPLSLPEELSESIKEKLRKIGYYGQKKLILYNMGAAWETKRWFPERWVGLIQKMKSEEIFPLLLWGDKVEKELAEHVNQKTGVTISPHLSLKEVMALIRESTLLISGDTFALQAACAFSRPVVGIFGPTNPQRNGPFCPNDKVAFHELECSYCYKRRCSDLECLKRISSEEVADLCLQLLEENA